MGVVKEIESVDFKNKKIKFCIYEYRKLFYFKMVSYTEFISDTKISIGHENDSIRENLNFPPHIYYEILFKNNGIYKGKHVEYNDYYFNSVNDIENVISELESYAIMNKLVE